MVGFIDRFGDEGSVDRGCDNGDIGTARGEELRHVYGGDRVALSHEGEEEDPELVVSGVH